MFYNLNSHAFQKAIEHEQNIILLDVRSREEYENGHIPGAELFDFRHHAFEEKVKQLDSSKTYMIYCRSGVRSSNAAFLMANSSLKVYNLQGGIMSWPYAVTNPSKKQTV